MSKWNISFITYPSSWLFGFYFFDCEFTGHRCYLEYHGRQNDGWNLKLCSENRSNPSSIEIFIVLLFTNPPRYGTGAILSFFVYKLVCVYILLWLVKLLYSFLSLYGRRLTANYNVKGRWIGSFLQHLSKFLLASTLERHISFWN